MAAEAELDESSAQCSEDDAELLETGLEDGPEEEELTASAVPKKPLDPLSDRAFVLPSMFKGRPPTVWMDYPAYMQIQREEGREDVVALTDKR